LLLLLLLLLLRRREEATVNHFAIGGERLRGDECERLARAAGDVVVGGCAFGQIYGGHTTAVSRIKRVGTRARQVSARGARSRHRGASVVWLRIFRSESPSRGTDKNPMPPERTRPLPSAVGLGIIPKRAHVRKCGWVALFSFSISRAVVAGRGRRRHYYAWVQPASQHHHARAKCAGVHAAANDARARTDTRAFCRRGIYIGTAARGVCCTCARAPVGAGRA
jgi:hypothetical protein